MKEEKLLTKEEALERAKKEAAAAADKALESNRTLKDLLSEKTDGDVVLPRANLNAMALIEEELGSLVEIDLNKISNVRAIVWALLNQENDDVLNWNPRMRKEAIFQVGKDLTFDNIDKVSAAVMTALDMRQAEGNAEEVSQSQEQAG